MANLLKKVEVLPTPKFSKWFSKLKDQRAKGYITSKLDYLQQSGNLSILKPLRKGISELRIHEGQGFRIYVTVIDKKVIVLLSGGTKKTQEEDIKEAIKLLNE
jgi:putative addiction module killer protein